MGEHSNDAFPVIPGLIIGGRIARGRHGTVFAATRQSDGAQLAIKCQNRGGARPNCLASLLHGISHPNLVRVLDLPEADGAYQVMELVEGVSLRELLLAVAAADEDVPLAICAEIARQIAFGLDALHAIPKHALVHGDVSPSNILLGHDGVVRVVDLGSLMAEGAPPADRFGTPGYLAPEALEASPALQASDVYAFGSLLFEMMTSSPPLYAMTPETAAPDVQDVRDDVPPQLEELLYELLAQRPDARPDAKMAALRLSNFVESCSPRPNLSAYVGSFFGDLAHAQAPELPSPQRPSASETNGPRISGAAVKATFEYVVRSYGAKGYELVRARLSPQTQAILQRHVDSAAWFDASVLVELTEVVESIFGVGESGEVARSIGAASADYALSANGPYRVFRERGLREGVPAFLHATEDIYGLYYDRGRWCVETVSKGSASARLIAGAGFPPPIVERIFAYLVRGLELVGAEDVVLERELNGNDWVVRLLWNAPAE